MALVCLCAVEKLPTNSPTKWLSMYEEEEEEEEDFA